MKVLGLVFLLLSLSACGAVDRLLANWTGDASEVCMNGVLYYQFTSGSALAVDQSGKPIKCN